MADYSSVLSRAIAGKKTYEERRVVYERARNALINQLRALTPPLPEADITRQRLALEESIRKVEAEASAAAEGEPAAAPPAPAPVAQPPRPVAPPPPEPARAQPPRQAAPPPPAPAAVPPPRLEPPPPPPPPPLQSPLGETVRRAEGLGGASATAARAAREQLDQDEMPREPPPRRADPRLSDAGPGEPALARMRSLPATAPERVRPNRRPLIFGAIAAVLLSAVVAVVVVLWLPPGEGGDSRSRNNGQEQPPKITDRIAQDTTTPQRPAPGNITEQIAPAQPQQGAALAQTALLYEENADNPRGADSFRGQVTWRVDTEAGPNGPERIIRGLVEIPDRGLKVLVTIRRNTDQALPASHTVELLFDVAANFVHGAVENVAGVRMKPSEQANGVPLVGASARITAGYFLIGLTATGPERDRNIVLLRDRPWMDLPIVYRNGRRAVLAIEKGVPGEQAFEQAFQAWR